MSHACSSCGSPLPIDAPAGLCPRCLLQAGLEELTVVPAAGITAGSAERPEALHSIRYFGDYELLEEIARGGMGVVYKARQVSLNRIVAVKMILAGHLANALDIQRFHAEAESAARLDHPGIVPIYEIGEHQGQQFFSMGYVAGDSLARQVAEGPLPPREATDLIARICDAVQYAHEQGIVHRDLKPANVLIDESGQPRITDFGLAKQLQVDSGLTGTGQILGTPSYMPPEQASGKIAEIGPATDVYSLGAVLYCVLTGRPPFQAATAIDTVMQVLGRDPVPLRELNPQVPADLETITLKCLEKDRGRRYPSARALAEELRRWLTGEPIHARPISDAERLLKWIRRRPVTAGLSAAVALSLLIGSAATMYFAYQANERAREATTRELAEREALTKLKYNFYFNLIARSDSEWRAGNSTQALKILDECDTAQRGWEWHYLRRRCYPQGSVLNHASGETRRVVFSPSGRFVVAATEYQDLQIWNLRTGQNIVTRRLHASQIMTAGFTPDETKLISVDSSGNTLIWNTQDGATVASFNDWRGVTRLSFHSDGKHVLTNLGIRNIESGESTMNLPFSQQLFDVRYSPDEAEIWTLQPGGIVRYDLTGRVIEEPPAAASAFVSTHAVFTHDRRQIVAVKSRVVNNLASTSLGIFDATTLEPVTWLGELRGVELQAVAIADNARIVAAVSRDTSNSHGTRWLNVWNAQTGRLLARLEGQYPLLQDVAIDPDGQTVAWGNAQAVVLWKLPTSRGVRKIAGTAAPLIGLRIAENPDRVIWGDRTGSIRDIDIATGQVSEPLSILNQGYSHLDERSRLAIDPEGKWIALSANLSVRAMKRQAGSEPLEMKTMSTSNYFTRAVIDPVGNRIAAADATGVKFWNLTTGTSTGPDLPLENPSAMAGNNDGTLLAVGSSQQLPPGQSVQGPRPIVTIIDAATSKVAFELGQLRSPAACIAFSRDGQYLAAATGMNSSDYGIPQPVKGEICVWDMKTHEVVQRLSGHATDVSQVSFDANSNRLFSGSIDGTIKVWELKTGQEVLTLRGHPNEVKDLAISTSGLLVSGGAPQFSGHGEILLWDGRPLDAAAMLPVLNWPSDSAAEVLFDQSGGKAGVTE